MSGTTAGEILNEVSETMEYAQKTKPDQQAAFMNFNAEVLKPGELTTKAKELIAVAVSISSSCEWCITFHVKKAKELGATEGEILEAAYVAVLMAGAPSLMNITLVRRALSE